MAEFLNGLKRTDYAGTLRDNDISREVVIMGWVQKRRNLGSLIFVDVRDRTGICQAVFDKTINSELFIKAESIRSEYVIAIKGVVRERQSKTDKIKTGNIEILASEVKILAEADTTPFEILDNVDVNENLRLKYRYLDLRRPALQNKLLTRHAITKSTRNYLDENGFIEVDSKGYITLTQKGKSVAERISERHAVLTEFFKKIGVSSDTAEKDACRIEHIISDETFERLKNIK